MKTATPDLGADSSRPAPVGTPGLILFLGLALIIFSCAVSSRTFWIDEAAAVTKAVQPTLADWSHEMSVEGGSDRQMPLYMFVLWVWEKLFGRGEWMLRAAGIPWLVAGLFIFAGKRVERWIVVTFSAFTWYCLDEARPYAMQLGASLAVFGSLERIANPPPQATARHDRIWLGVFAASVLVLSGSSLLGMIWAGAAVAAFVGIQTWDQPRGLLWSHKLLWSFTALLLAGLAMYYLVTIRAGAGASPAGPTDWRNILFIVAEVFGFSGLGPGRLELRENGAAAIREHAPALAAMAALAAMIAVEGLRRTRSRLTSRRGFYLALVVCGAAGLLLAIGAVKHFRVLGRHFTPVAPVVFWIFAEGIASLWRSGAVLKRCLVIGYLIASFASCLSLRLASRHNRDDYRAAAHVANQAIASGEIVWWCADLRGGQIYGVPMKDYKTRYEAGQAVFIWNASVEQLSALPMPGIAFISKPDIFDNRNVLSDFLKRNGFEITDQKHAFSIWRRTPRRE